MNLINTVSAEAGPNSWSENMKECKIHGKIVYFKGLDIFKNDCDNIYDAIVKDENNYYNVTIKETLATYMYFSEDTTKGYEGVCEGYSSSGTTDNSGNIIYNSIKPKVGDDYYFVVTHYFDYDNVVMKYSKQETKDWNILANCTDNIIDKINKSEIIENINKLQEQNIKTELLQTPEISKNIDFSNTIIYSIILLVILLPIISIYIYKKIKKL